MLKVGSPNRESAQCTEHFCCTPRGFCKTQAEHFSELLRDWVPSAKATHESHLAIFFVGIVCRKKNVKAARSKPVADPIDEQSSKEENL